MFISINDLLFLFTLSVFLILAYSRIIYNRSFFALVGQKFRSIDKKQRIKDYLRQVTKKPEDLQKVVFKEVIIFIFALVIMGLLASKAIFFTAVVSGSMSPTFETDDLVLMENIDHSYKPGDIIMFSRPDTSYPVAHRIKLITDKGIMTAGDATGELDWWQLDKKDILGKSILIQGKPIIIKGLGKYFIMDERHQDFGPFGQDYNRYFLFFQVIKIYGYVITLICLFIYIVITFKQKPRHSQKY